MSQYSSLDTPGLPQSMVSAAQYVRMSTEHQQYSTENQADAIREYAQRHGFQITATYADDGKSGLRLEGRHSLQRLIADVEKGVAGFKTILVYDISRWGRFQDADESAYYEYVCRRAGINVEYCAEQFANDGSPTATIIKSVKRAMAGEYSRELSTKVFKGQCRLIELGFRQGGPAGYGLRRMLISANGDHKGILKRGEHKSFQTDRVLLVPGPDDELDIVRQIYAQFTTQGRKEAQIADWLNASGIAYEELDRPWSAAMVHQVLTNEKYIGNNIYNRISFKLKKKRVKNLPEMWVRREGAFQAIVDPATFYTARGIILERARRFTNDEMIQKLKDLLEQQGELSADLINDADGMPGSSAYKNRFGSLIKAYRLAGFVPARDYRYLEVNLRLRELEPPFMQEVLQKLSVVGASVTRLDESGQLLINGEFTADILFVRCSQTPAGTLRWRVNLDRKQIPDITVVIRMDSSNQSPMDFYFFPRIDVAQQLIHLDEDNWVGIDTYRFDGVSYFLNLAARRKIEVNE